MSEEKDNADTSKPLLHQQNGNYQLCERNVNKHIGLHEVNSDKNKILRRVYTREQKIIFICVALANLFQYVSWSLLAPFFPTEAVRLGATPTEVGLIFGIYSLVQFLSSPIFGKFLPIIGARFMYISGYFITAGCNVLFGFLDRLNSGSQFVIFCVVTRSLEGIGTAAVLTAGMSIIANTFPDAISQVMGIIEIFVGIGLMIGPFIGGLLYEAGGYIVPFATLGGVMLLQCLILVFLLPQDDDNVLKKCGSYKLLWSIPGTWVGTCAVFVGSASLTFLDPTLSPELEKFNLTPSQVGLMFLLMGFSYGVSAPIFGWLADKYDISRILIIVGCLVAWVGYLVLGSWVPLHIPHTIVTMSIGMVVINISIGTSLTPTFQDYLNTVTFNGMPDDMSTYSVVSGMFMCAYSLGSFVGPLVGGVLVENYSFATSSSVFGFLNLAVAVVIFVFSTWEFKCWKGRRKTVSFLQLDYATDEEHNRLLIE